MGKSYTQGLLVREKKFSDMLKMVRQTSFRTFAVGPQQWNFTGGGRLGSTLNTDGQVGIYS